MTSRQDEAQIIEVFSSIQGEGLYVGRRQVFVRFAGCNLECRFCDTPRTESNPVSVERLNQIVNDLAKAARHHSISLTGGEPLLHAEFIRRWLLTRSGGPDVHVETNGTLPDALEKVIGLVDVTAMDIKLPSASGQPARYDENLHVLPVAAQREVFVKVVFTDATPDDELAEVVRIVSRVNHAIPTVLQPVSGAGCPRPARVLSAHAFVSKGLANVLVIPQTHKMLGCM